MSMQIRVEVCGDDDGFTRAYLPIDGAKVVLLAVQSIAYEASTDVQEKFLSLIRAVFEVALPPEMEIKGTSVVYPGAPLDERKH